MSIWKKNVKAKETLSVIDIRHKRKLYEVYEKLAEKHTIDSKLKKE